MNRKIKNIASWLLLMVFIFPSIVQFEHHHEHISPLSENEKPNTVLRDNCAICSFEFSVFDTTIERISLLKENPEDSYCNIYNSRQSSNLCKLSFLLRAPPVFQV